MFWLKLELKPFSINLIWHENATDRKNGKLNQLSLGHPLLFLSFDILFKQLQLNIKHGHILLNWRYKKIISCQQIYHTCVKRNLHFTSFQQSCKPFYFSFCITFFRKTLARISFKFVWKYWSLQVSHWCFSQVIFMKRE